VQMKMTTIKIKDRTGTLDHRCLEHYHYVTIFDEVGRYQAGFLVCSDFNMSCYTTGVELICGMTGMAHEISPLGHISAAMGVF
jgi:hypothetical protein